MKSLISLIVFSLISLCSSTPTNYKLECQNNATILVELESSIEVAEGAKTYTFMNGDNITGDCTHEPKRAFSIQFENKTELKLIVENHAEMVYLTELEVSVANKETAFVLSLNQSLSPSDAYYICGRKTYELKSSSVPGDKAIVNFDSLKLQAFNVKDGVYSEKAAQCANPSTASTAPPTTSKSTTASTTTKSTTVSTTPKSTTVSTTQKSTSPPTTSKSTAPSTTPKSTAASTTVMTTTLATSIPSTVAPTPGTGLVKLQLLGKDKKVCLFVEFNGTLTFQYNMTGVKTDYAHIIDHGDVKHFKGSCEGDVQHVTAMLSMGCSVEFRFTRMGNKKDSMRRLLSGEYSLTNVSVTYDTSKAPNATGGKSITVNSNSSIYNANLGESFGCTSSEKLVSNSEMSFEVVKFSAGAFSSDPNNVMRCDADKSGSNNIVPIVVGVILACLVVIIIIAYLIGRRRNRDGYQSV